MHIIAIVQARVGSTRLPGKILKSIKGKVVLDYVFERLKLCKNINDLVLATTIKKKDDVLEEYSQNRGITYFRGNENDVLNRYYHAAKKYGGDIIVRITSDCPLIDPNVVDRVIRKHIDNPVDYTSNTLQRTYPRGLDAEVFGFNALEVSYRNANKKYQREHVTPYMWEQTDKFKIQNVEAKGKLKRPDLRLTLDTLEDFELIKKIINHFDNIFFGTGDIIDFLDKYPELLQINKFIGQKGLKE